MQERLNLTFRIAARLVDALLQDLVRSLCLRAPHEAVLITDEENTNRISLLESLAAH